MVSPKGKIATKLREVIQGIKGVLSPSICSDTLVANSVPINSSKYKSSLIFTSFVIHILSLALPVMTLQIYDRILVSQNISTLHMLVSGVVIAVLLESVLRLFRAYIVNWSNASYEHAIACNSLRHVLNSELTVLENEGVGEQVQRMDQIGKLKEFTGGQAMITLIDLPFVCVYLSLIAYLARELVFVPLILLLCFSYIAWVLGNKIRDSLMNREAADESKFSFIIEALSGIHTVKSLGVEARFQRRYEDLQKQSSVGSFYVAKVGSLVTSYGATFTQLMTILVIAFGAPMAMSGSITLGTLIACVLLSGRIISPLQKALGIWTRYQDFVLAKNSVQEVFNMPLVDYITDDSVEEKDGSVELNGICFSYRPEDPDVIKNVSISLVRGDCISISGEHSCGKTTLLKLVSGLYQASSGTVKINGLNAHTVRPEDMISHVGYMPMDGVIFKGTIRENLTGFGLIPEERVNEIIKLLAIDKEIKKLPSGFDTHLDGVSADPIPPGLKQRIVIARVLSSKPRVILFDDADRSLDKDGYQQIYKLLAKLKGKVTLVIITDDQNIKRLADREFRMEGGGLRELHAFDSSKDHDVKPFKELRL